MIPGKAEPAQIGFDRSSMLGLGALGVGIVDPQQQFAAGFAGEQPVDERGADIAEMQSARRAGRKPETHSHELP